MSPERPGRWVILRQGAGKNWQDSQSGRAPGQAFGARLGAPNPILRCLLTGSWGSRGGLRGTLAGLVLRLLGSSSGGLPVSLGRLPGCPSVYSFSPLSSPLRRLMPAGAPDSGYWSWGLGSWAWHWGERWAAPVRRVGGLLLLWCCERVRVWGGGGAGLPPWHLSGGRIRQDSGSRSGLRQPLPRFPVRCGPAMGSAGGDASGCCDVVLDSGCRRPPPRSCREAGTGLWRERIPLALPLLPPHPFSLCHSAGWGAHSSSPCSGLVLRWEDYGK